jgi:K+/H+ antiporter YhaU regulatory subunit KhtT
MDSLFVQGLVGIFFAAISGGLGIWLRNLTSTIEKLREEQRRAWEVFQLKSDAVRDQEQIMAMLAEIKQSLERMNNRIDRRNDGGSR